MNRTRPHSPDRNENAKPPDRLRGDGCPGRLDVFETTSPEETRLLGRHFGRNVEADAVAALVGPLGAGKTCFVQGVGRGLDVRRTVNSPTFVLMKRYRGRLQLIHWDWYRLESEDDLESAGFGDLQVERGVVLIEWADKFIEELAEPFLRIEFNRAGAEHRRIRMRVCGESKTLQRFLDRLAQLWRERSQ